MEHTVEQERVDYGCAVLCCAEYPQAASALQKCLKQWDLNQIHVIVRPQLSTRTSV